MLFTRITSLIYSNSLYFHPLSLLQASPFPFSSLLSSLSPQMQNQQLPLTHTPKAQVSGEQSEVLRGGETQSAFPNLQQLGTWDKTLPPAPCPSWAFAVFESTVWPNFPQLGTLTQKLQPDYFLFYFTSPCHLKYRSTRAG